MKRMSGKWIAAGVILCVLAGAFFLGGPGSGAQDGTPLPETTGQAAPAPDPDAALPDTDETAPERGQSEQPAEAYPPSQPNEPEEPPVPASEGGGTAQAAMPSAEPEPAAPDGGGGTQAQAAEELTCTLSVSCATVLDHLDRLNPDIMDILPADGVIFAETAVPFSPGQSAFDLLKRELTAAQIHFEFMDTPIYNASYIEGIANLYEFDCGALSGWMYRVNGAFEHYGSSLRLLADGDAVEFLYTCDLGRDVVGYVEG